MPILMGQPPDKTVDAQWKSVPELHQGRSLCSLDYHGTMGQGLMIGLLVVYAALIPVPSNYHLNPDVRLWLFQNRPFIILGLMTVGFAVLWAKGLTKISPELKLALLFPLWTTVLAPITGTPIPELGLYWMWALFAFALLPQLDRWRFLFKGLTVTYAVFWVLILILGRSELSGLPRLPTYGYLNEDYYGQIIQLLVISSLMWLYMARHRTKLVLLLYGLVTWHLFVVNARNVLAFLVVTAVAYGWMRGKGRWSTHSIAPVLAVAFVGLLFVYTNSYYPGQSANEVSSGRVQIWEEAAQGLAFGGRLFVINLLVGSDTALPEGVSYDPLSEEATFSTTHVDNAFLEILLKFGLVGLILFMAPYVHVFRRGRQVMKTRWHTLALAVFVGGFMQSMLASTIPTFGSPVGFLFAACAALPVQDRVEQVPQTRLAPRSRLAIGREELAAGSPVGP